MKPFVFRWQRMLALAEGFERDRRIALAAAVGRLTRAEDELTALRRERQELMEKRSKLLSGGSNITEVQDNYQGELVIEFRIASQENVVEGCRDEVGKRREELTERMRERKTYDKLRERAWERYRVDSDREEIRVVDDIAGKSFGRTFSEEAGEVHE